MMNQLEYVIEELERALRVWLYERTDRNLMLVQPDVVEDAIAILKALADARQARVIKKEELGKLPSGCVLWWDERAIIKDCPEPTYPICFERAGDMTIGINETIQAIEYNGVIHGSKHDRLDQYGKLYRLWTARPTDEQRREEKWEDHMT